MLFSFQSSPTYLGHKLFRGPYTRGHLFFCYFNVQTKKKILKILDSSTVAQKHLVINRVPLEPKLASSILVFYFKI